MTEIAKPSQGAREIGRSLEAWDRLVKAFDNLPNDQAKQGFLDYAQALLDFGKLRRYLKGGRSGDTTSPLHGVLFAMQLDDERVWANSKSGKDQYMTALAVMYQGLSCEAEQVAFAQFADAVIGYHITKNEIAPAGWRDWSI